MVQRAPRARRETKGRETKGRQNGPRNSRKGEVIQPALPPRKRRRDETQGQG